MKVALVLALLTCPGCLYYGHHEKPFTVADLEALSGPSADSADAVGVFELYALPNLVDPRSLPKICSDNPSLGHPGSRSVRNCRQSPALKPHNF